MKKLNTLREKFIKSASKTFYPGYGCLLCGIEVFGARFCAECYARLKFNDGETCPVCGRKTMKNEICIECKAYLPAFDKAVSALEYDGAAPQLVTSFKNSRPYLADWFAEIMAAKAALLPAADGIVPVPMTRKAERRRGYNQAGLLAQRISAIKGIPVLWGAVIKAEDTKNQKGLTRAERIKNLSRAFKSDKKAVAGKTILIVDDVMTTGATLNCITESLKKAGAAKVFCVTAASVTYSVTDPR